MIKNLLAFTFLLSISLNTQAQNELVKDTTYLRYNRTPGSEKLANYMVVRTKLPSGMYEFEEYYKFTSPMMLKKKYIGYGNGKKDGAYQEYDREGFIEEEGSYTEDKKEGLWTYYKNGQLSCKVSYTNDEKEGTATYYANNEELYTWQFHNGKSDGFNRSYYEDGTLKFEGTYINGELEGTSIDYDKKGDTSVVAIHKNGKLNGPYKRYRKNGNFMSVGSYTDNNESGEWKWYREDGTLASHEFYNDEGKLKDVTFYDEKGQEIRSRKKDVFTGLVEEKNKLNKVIREHITKNYEYPPDLFQKGIEGRVYVKFQIDKEGKVCDIECKSDTHPALELQAKNLIAGIPRQNPARIHNMPMGVLFAIPLVFQIR